MVVSTSPVATRVLIVDDDDAVRRGLEFALDVAGFAVETFASGEALLARAPPRGRLCMLIDERLPGISGLETLRQVWARHGMIPAVLVTTHPPLSLREAAAAAHAPILEKPLIADQVIEAINAQLDS